MSAIVVINGYPGVGKHTVAAQLAKKLPETKIFDTHNLDLAASALFDSYREVKQYGELRQDLRRTVLKYLPARSPKAGAANGTNVTHGLPIYIFTDTLLSSPLARSTLQQYLTVGIPVVHIILSADTESNIIRLSSDPTRKSRGKLVDEDALREIRMEDEVGRLLNGAVRAVEGLAGEYEIETSAMDAGVVAGVVLEYVLEALRGAGVWITMARKGRDSSIQAF